MAISGLISVYNLKSLRFSILPQSDIFAMTPTTLQIKIKKRYFLSSYLIRCKIHNTEKLIASIKENSLLKLNVIFEKRGKYKISEIEISSYFPFFFFLRSIRIPVVYEVIVFPKLIKSDYYHYIAEGKKNIESSSSKGKSYEGEIIGLKVYNPQDPLRYIHWKASAKISELMTKEFSPYKGNPVLVNLSDFTGDIEQKIGKAAYVIMNLSQQGIPVGLKLDNITYKPDSGNAHLRRLLNALALY